MATFLRNIAIIAHVDHGKTTLVDKLLQQSGTLDTDKHHERVMDSDQIEQERGITIIAKPTAILRGDYKINIVDTPGHADFGGEVERILAMVDAVVLLVDAVEGPMPQTTFVTQKAFEHGLNPILVVNKIDRDGARPHEVIDEVFDLFDRLGATDEQLDFPIVYASAIEGFATLDADVRTDNMDALFDMIIDKTPPPDVDPDAPFQMQITTLDYSSYVGAIGIGRVTRGTARSNMPVTIVKANGEKKQGRILQIMTHLGLERLKTEEASAGDIICINGIDNISISDTLCDPNHVEAMAPLIVDEPTVSMTFSINDSPFSGREGKYVTSRQIRERLEKELIHNVALRVEDTDSPDAFLVSGRGELHLAILIENMRREGYELSVSRPHVIVKEIDGVMSEPYEMATVTVDNDYQGRVMEMLSERHGELKEMAPDIEGRVRLVYKIPAKSLIGFYTDFLTQTSGTGIMHHIFEAYGPYKPATKLARRQGAMISNQKGSAVGFSLFNLQERGRMFLSPGEDVYEGMLVGLHVRENDLVVNVCKGKQLTNIRASGTDENIILTPPLDLSLERALEIVAEDELVEVTPKTVRMRKKYLSESDRKRMSRAGNS